MAALSISSRSGEGRATSNNRRTNFQTVFQTGGSPRLPREISSLILLIYLVGAARFELATPSPPDWCANRAALRSEARNALTSKACPHPTQPRSPSNKVQKGNRWDTSDPVFPFRSRQKSRCDFTIAISTFPTKLDARRRPIRRDPNQAIGRAGRFLYSRPYPQWNAPLRAREHPYKRRSSLWLGGGRRRRKTRQRASLWAYTITRYG
jgi:hypothetical protein